MSDLPRLASLLKSRNTIDDKISTLIGRTAQANNIGEYIASIIFPLSLHFLAEPLQAANNSNNVSG